MSRNVDYTDVLRNIRNSDRENEDTCLLQKDRTKNVISFPFQRRIEEERRRLYREIIDSVKHIG
jgi:hypothetical protein